MLDYFYTNSNIFSLSKVSMYKSGVFDSDKYISTLNDLITEDSFDNLKCHLTINATDVLAGKSVYFDSGNKFKQKIIASAAVPGVFSPVKINGTYYIDGGIMDNFPITPLLDKDLILFGSFLSMHGKVTKKELSNTVKLLSRASQIEFNSDAMLQLDLCDYLVASRKVAKHTLFDITKLKEIYKIGYKESQKYLSGLDLKAIKK